MIKFWLSLSRLKMCLQFFQTCLHFFQCQEQHLPSLIHGYLKVSENITYVHYIHCVSLSNAILRKQPTFHLVCLLGLTSRSKFGVNAYFTHPYPISTTVCEHSISIFSYLNDAIGREKKISIQNQPVGILILKEKKLQFQYHFFRCSL